MAWSNVTLNFVFSVCPFSSYRERSGLAIVSFSLTADESVARGLLDSFQMSIFQKAAEMEFCI